MARSWILAVFLTVACLALKMIFLGSSAGGAGGGETFVVEDADLPMGWEPRGNIGAAAGGSREIRGPKSAGEVILLLMVFAAVFYSRTLLRTGNLRWGVPVIGAAVLVLMYVMDTKGLNDFKFNPWKWGGFFGFATAVTWIVAKSTAAKWDDWVISKWPLIALVLSFFAGVIPAGFDKIFPAPVWWVLWCLWAWVIGDAIWDSVALKARPGLKWAITTVPLFILCAVA